VIYLDTSALAKKYIRNEPGHEKVIEIVGSEQGPPVSSALTRLEMISALTRRKNDIAGYEGAIDAFNDDWNSFLVWAIDDETLSGAADLILRHKLRAADSIHLATLICIRQHLKGKMLFLCSDKELFAAAEAEGFHALDPSFD
jgi:uncharacterized protein